MKIERRFKENSLWDFVTANLPNSLVPRDLEGGYGAKLHYVYQRGVGYPGVVAGIFGGRGDPVAYVSSSRVELYYAEYFSTFEDLIRNYESATGDDVTLEYWQSAKDERPGENRSCC